MRKCDSCPPEGYCATCRQLKREAANERWHRLRKQHRCGRCGRKVRKRRFKLPTWKRWKTVYPAECKRCQARTRRYQDAKRERDREIYKPV